MLKRVLDLFFSLQVTFILALIFMIAQIYATLGFASDSDAWLYVYGRGWFEAIMWFLSINLLGIMYKFKTYKKIPLFLLHSSLIVILLGAGITRYFGKEGVLHLRVGETSGMIMLQNKANPADVGVLDMKFKLKLDKFRMNKYPGTTQPSSYESFVTVIDGDKSFHYHIYMNHILVYKGFRVYQMSYDPDEQGTILLVGKDPGMWITYLGYLLLAIGFFVSMFYKKSQFMRVAKKLKESGLFALLLSFVFFNTHLNAVDLDEFAKNSKQVATEFSKILVQYNGRIKPLDSLNVDFIQNY